MAHVSDVYQPRPDSWPMSGSWIGKAWNYDCVPDMHTTYGRAVRVWDDGCHVSKRWPVVGGSWTRRGGMDVAQQTKSALRVSNT